MNKKHYFFVGAVLLCLPVAFSLGVFYEREVRLPGQESREVWYVGHARVSQDYRQAVMIQVRMLESAHRSRLEEEALKKEVELYEFRRAAAEFR